MQSSFLSRAARGRPKPKTIGWQGIETLVPTPSNARAGAILTQIFKNRCEKLLALFPRKTAESKIKKGLLCRIARAAPNPQSHALQINQPKHSFLLCIRSKMPRSFKESFFWKSYLLWKSRVHCPKTLAKVHMCRGQRRGIFAMLLRA